MWATTAEIQATVGVAVTDVTRSLAAQAIEMHTGLIEGVQRVNLSDRNAYWLKLAVAYQAAWLVAQPDYLDRNAVSSATQDGQSATGANPEWLTLSPLARKSIKRLDWRGTRGLVVAARPGQGAYRVVNGRVIFDEGFVGNVGGDALISGDTWEDRQNWKPA